MTAPVLALPNFSLPFWKETDASNAGVGVVLTQASHPIAYLSKALGPKVKRLSTYEKEFFAIIMAMDHRCHYLQLKGFHIHTDHRSLIQLDEQHLNTSWQNKMFTLLLGLQYRIIYKKGVDNTTTDALSRQHHVMESCLAMSSETPLWITEVASSYAQDAVASAMITKLVVDENTVANYSWNDGLVCYKNRIWVEFLPELQHQLIEVFHTTSIGGHSGIQSPMPV